jgi:hypothetical protein
MRKIVSVALLAACLPVLAGGDKEEARQKAVQMYKQYFTAVLMSAYEGEVLDTETAMKRVARANGFKDWNDFAMKMVQVLGPQEWMAVVKETSDWFNGQLKAMQKAKMAGTPWEPEGGAPKASPEAAVKALAGYFDALLASKREKIEADHEAAQEKAAAENGFMGWDDFVARASADLGREAWTKAVDEALRAYQAEADKIEVAWAEEAEQEKAVAQGALTREKALLVLRDFYALTLEEGGGVVASREKAAAKYGFASWAEFVFKTKETLGSEIWVAVTGEANRWYKDRKKKAARSGGGASPARFERVFHEFFQANLEAVRARKPFDAEGVQMRVAQAHGFRDWNDYCMQAVNTLGPEAWQKVVEDASKWFTEELKKDAMGGGPPSDDGAKAPVKPLAPVPGSALDPVFRPGARMGDASAAEFYVVKQVLAEWIRGDLVKTAGGTEQVARKNHWVHVPSKGWKWAPVPK